MKRLLTALAGVSLCVSTIAGASAQDRTFEQYALDLPSIAGVRQSLVRINAASHYAGTPADQDLAAWMRDALAADGFEATLETLWADVPQPKKIALEILTAPKAQRVDLRETPIAADPDGSRSDAWIPFNAFSGDGDVSAAVVDAGHGVESDYASLKTSNIDVRGRIALIRYGREFRGLLARRAQGNGAAAVIFFSDPDDRDGSRRGIAYPDGPYRPLGSVQRGSLGTPRLDIPVLPVTASTAARITAFLRDRVSVVPVHVHVEETIKHQTLWNTVGVLRGTDPTHSIVLGAHRDAWVYGVTDNGSGISVLLEVAHALGYLYRSGWRPRFSIVIAGFDGEEIGEAGSQAYVRSHLGELLNGCVAYINEDEATTGQRFGATAAAALEDVLVPATLRVPDPREPRQTLYDRWKAQPDHVSIDGPGGGSDFEPFLYDAGVPILDLNFGGTFGVYHSAFDDLRYAETQADPGLVNHRAIAQTVALLAMRLANGTLAYRFTPYVARMRTALAQLATQTQTSPKDVAPVFRAIDRFAARAASVDRRGMDAGAEILSVHHLNRLFYGRNGYAAVAFPQLAPALERHDRAATSAAVGRTVHELDGITANMH